MWAWYISAIILGRWIFEWTGRTESLGTDEPVEVQDIGKLPIILSKSVEYISKMNQKITTCNWLDLETVGSRSIMTKNLLRHGVFRCALLL